MRRIVIAAAAAACALSAVFAAACGGGHTLVERTELAPTCESAGHIAYWECTDCGAYFADGAGTDEITFGELVIPATWHDWLDAGIVKEPTCTGEGARKLTCAVCGDEKQEIIPATGHNYELIERADSCEEAGTLYYECSVCGDGYTGQTKPLGHDWGPWQVVTEPTKTGGGTVSRTCRRDREHVESYSLPALNETDYDYALVPATCAEDGREIYFYSDANVAAAFTVTVERVPHTFEMRYDGRRHWQMCAECGFTQGYEEHDLGVGCNICGGQFAEGLEYALSDDGTYYEVTGAGTWSGDVLLIPEEHDGRPVKGIGDRAFLYEGNGNRVLQSVLIPANVEYIGEYAFAGHMVVRELCFTPESHLKSIGRGAFFGSYYGKTLNLPDSVTEIGDSALYGSRNLAAIEFGMGSLLESLGSDAFGGLSALDYAVIPASLVSVGETPLPVSAYDDDYIVYYGGTAEEWQALGMDIAENATVYYYCESQPQAEGNFWHYSQDGAPIEW